MRRHVFQPYRVCERDMPKLRYCIFGEFMSEPKPSNKIPIIPIIGLVVIIVVLAALGVYLYESDQSSLSAYNNLEGQYSQLQAGEANLNSQFITLYNQHANLENQYSSLNSSYSSLLSNYTQLASSQVSLQESFSHLSNQYNSLHSNYTQLSSSYATLNETYEQLLSEYNALISEYPQVSINLYAGEINSSQYGFGNSSGTLESPGPSFTVPLDSIVTVTMYNVGTMGHAWELVNSLTNSSEVFGAAIGSNSTPIFPDSNGNVTFLASAAGTYYYICPVDGHQGLGMYGNFTVL